MPNDKELLKFAASGIENITMKRLLLLLVILITNTAYAQKLAITTADKSKVTVTLLDSASKSKLIEQFRGKPNNALRKKWTARTFQLTDGQILIEFYDRQAVLINNPDDFKRLADVRFVKNTLNFLKKNISYKIELDYNNGLRILQNEKPKRRANNGYT